MVDTQTQKRGISRKVRAILAGGLVLGIGAAVTLASWNDAEYASGTFTISTFDLQSSLTNVPANFLCHPVGTPLALLFDISLIMFKTGSMSPTIPAGSVAMVREIPASEMRVGDVVTVDRTDKLPITHRVTTIEPAVNGAKDAESRTFTMRGDANDSDDVEPYTASTVRIVLGSVPGLANVIVWFSNPFVLGGITLAAAVLLLLLAAVSGLALGPASPAHAAEVESQINGTVGNVAFTKCAASGLLLFKQLDLAWNVPASGTIAPAGYLVEFWRLDTLADSTTVTAQSLSVTPGLLSGLLNGGAYTIQIYALQQIGSPATSWKSPIAASKVSSLNLLTGRSSRS